MNQCPDCGEMNPADIHTCSPQGEQPAKLDSANRSADSAEAFCNQEIYDLTSLGGRLALELECLLLECPDMAAVSKWWDSAHEALQAWRDHLWSVRHGDAVSHPGQQGIQGNS